MPMAIDMFTGEKLNEKDKRRATLIIRYSNVAFYTLALAWFLVSAITGNFVWRMSVNLCFFFITFVFMISLIRINRFISQINSRKQFKANTNLMSVNLITFAIEAILFLISFVLSMYDESASDVTTTQDCRILMTLYFNYWVQGLALATRICVTCYMNVQFSRELEEKNH